ncbi:MAG TPA: thiamine pyrophosphate-dependent enzyme [Synergistaceae bacterium]|nr:thiamine pyrophosphate-dependent enzyme [Synergistaceae bacterium]HPQ38127.1 thiamine pyrophosphate-dependent enzyme [Synergistaceae bacterium]
MVDPRQYDLPGADVAWCPGCGNFQIMESLKAALGELDYSPEEVVLVSGIGQAAKMPHFMKGHFFNGLHGRALSVATGIRAANPNLLVLAIGGDGDMYGEGGNHFLHTMRRNPNIVNLVHNNMVYGLTKGQYSPTSPQGFVSPTSPQGVGNVPVNPMALAVAGGASFVARAFSGDPDETKEIIKKAILHRGYALVDIFQPCVSFNRVNTFKWYKDHTYYLDENYDPTNIRGAMEKALEQDRHALGVLYRSERPLFEDSLGAYRKDATPLFGREPSEERLALFLEENYG